MSKIKSFFSGEFLIIITAIMWGMISIFTRPLNGLGFSSGEITFMRSFLSIFLLGLYLLIKDKSLFKISLKDLPLLLFLGIGCFMTVCFLYILSIEKNGSSVAVMLEYTSPVWTVIISRFLFKEKITILKVISLVGILAGCALLSFGGEIHLNFVGILIGLGTGITLALYSLLSKVAGRKYSAETVTFYMFLFSAFGTFFISQGWSLPSKIISQPTSLYYFIGIAVFPTTLGYIFYVLGLKTVSAGKTSILSSLEIVVAVIVGILIFKDSVGLFGYIGMGITLFCLILLEIGDLKINREKELMD